MRSRSRLFLIGYLRLNRRWIFPVFLLPVLWRLICNLFGLDRALYSDLLIFEAMGTIEFLRSLLAILFFPMMVGIMLFSCGIGLTFKRQGPESWLARLPVGDFTLISLPYFLLGLLGILTFAVSPAAWIYASELCLFPVLFLLGVIPVGMYLAVRSRKNSTSGLILGVLIGVLLLGYGELMMQLANEKFNLVHDFSELFEFFYFRPAIELACLTLILILILIFEAKKPSRTLALGTSILVLGFASGMYFVWFQTQHAHLMTYLAPLDQISADHERERKQCEHFRSFVEKFVDNDLGQPLQSREEFYLALNELKKYPAQKSMTQELLAFYERALDELTQGLLLEHTFRIYQCEAVPKLNLQWVMIRTLVQKPAFFPWRKNTLFAKK